MELDCPWICLFCASGTQTFFVSWESCWNGTQRVETAGKLPRSGTFDGKLPADMQSTVFKWLKLKFRKGVGVWCILPACCKHVWVNGTGYFNFVTAQFRYRSMSPSPVARPMMSPAPVALTPARTVPSALALTSTSHLAHWEYDFKTCSW